MEPIKYNKISLFRKDSSSNYMIDIDANYKDNNFVVAYHSSKDLVETVTEAKRELNYLVMSFALKNFKETIKIDDKIVVEVKQTIKEPLRNEEDLPATAFETALPIEAPFDPEPLLKRIFNIVKASLGGNRDAAGTWMLEYARQTGFPNPRSLPREELQVLLEVATKLETNKSKLPQDDFVLEEKPKTQLPPQILETKKSEPTSAVEDNNLSIDERINLFILNPNLDQEQTETLMGIAEDTGYAQSLEETPTLDKKATFDRMHDLMLRWGIELL